jgi:hypothetical protein
VLEVSGTAIRALRTTPYLAGRDGSAGSITVELDGSINVAAGDGVNI